jgi:hypothetical protein
MAGMSNGPLFPGYHLDVAGWDMAPETSGGKLFIPAVPIDHDDTRRV